MPPKKKISTPKNPCKNCSFCCEHIALEFDKPTCKTDFEQILWFLIHKNVWVWIDHDDNGWYVQFDSKCKWLKNKRCSHYNMRPQICRDYPADDCYRHGNQKLYREVFRKPEDLFEYLKRKRPTIYQRMSLKP